MLTNNFLKQDFPGTAVNVIRPSAQIAGHNTTIKALNVPLALVICQKGASKVQRARPRGAIMATSKAEHHTSKFRKPMGLVDHRPGHNDWVQNWGRPCLAAFKG